ncbi:MULTISPECIES: helix-turn-helix domain-containing protein [Paenibacillus]|uniref:XRE family transcriptional regulator n=1 Tax=Paenibacillus polymyxa TaxID=1406 RepID=A0A378Y0R3_PAEPO|nr:MULTISPECIES: helix-turn-helix transcriptional regulator [Paenibacillus]KJD37382.1 transcriptional regulator [Paenibacillus polymyxa]KKD53924.1 transcriptional regulator [Paenibacillus sp. ICGEB2008]MBE7896026.1 helix-turn-helix transcriptional regulator [Paenibacillus polymyxa]MBG9766012.1 transcriptional regulator [Paenibacillus polymyxa]MCC3256563.1 helix-turn-helix transcriptional regulator [Paenibacillus polymyxa]
MAKVVRVRPNLTNILKERDMTQNQLSELSGVPQASISRFDKNERHEANILFSISKALNISIEDLFVEEQEEV